MHSYIWLKSRERWVMVTHWRAIKISTQSTKFDVFQQTPLDSETGPWAKLHAHKLKLNMQTFFGKYASAKQYAKHFGSAAWTQGGIGQTQKVTHPAYEKLRSSLKNTSHCFYGWFCVRLFLAHAGLPWLFVWIKQQQFNWGTLRVRFRWSEVFVTLTHFITIGQSQTSSFPRGCSSALGRGSG